MGSFFLVTSKNGTISISTVSNTYGGAFMSPKKRFEARASNQHWHSQYWAAGVSQSPTGSDEKAFAVFQPDILIPTQYLATFQRRFHLEPERLLMLAVLQDAIFCFQEHLMATCRRKRCLYNDAEEWLFNGDRFYVFSFENICEALGFEAAYLRQGLMRWKTVALAKHHGKQSGKRLAS